jgi:hypothetical protein
VGAEAPGFHVVRLGFALQLLANSGTRWSTVGRVSVWCIHKLTVVWTGTGQFGVRRQSAAATALSCRIATIRMILERQLSLRQGGVALRLPPHSIESPTNFGLHLSLFTRIEFPFLRAERDYLVRPFAVATPW